MANWKDLLKADPTDWLLELDNSSVRYFTLTDILERPTGSPEVSEARAAIPGSKDVQAIFARQDPTGWWDTPERATGIKRASGQLLILSRLGVPPDERTHRGCEFVLSKPWLPMRRPVCIVPCYTANCLRFLAHFGYGDDPRVDEGWRAMIERLEQDDGLICWYQKQHPCHWLAVKALWAFAAAPKGWDVRGAIARTAEALLSHDFDFEGEEACWLRFGFPWYFQSDLLDALEALAACGYAADPRFWTLVQHVVKKQQDDGRWFKEGGSTAVRIERNGQPSKWITLKALHVLKQFGEEVK
ncbi:MAG: hypothetical protein WBW48_21375 [Anaerolineae bacterium]